MGTTSDAGATGSTPSPAPSPGSAEAKPEELLTLEELTTRVGMSVRNVRFYTSKGLVPPPIRRGRSGFYTPDHVSRLELVRELQSHGFTLSAIEKYLAAVPEYKEAGASAETIREVVERIKPLSIASLVSAYEQAMDETRRERIRARAERGSK